jgi:uncharacterized membrane protein
MKKLILSTVLLSIVSFSSMAARKPQLNTKNTPAAKAIALKHAAASAVKPTKVAEWECYEVTLSCDLHGIECGEFGDVIIRVIKAEEENCGG